MSHRNSQNLRPSSPSVYPSFESVTNDLDVEEEYIRRLTTYLSLGTSDNNYELMTSHRRQPVKHIAIQTISNIEEKYYPWLLDMESKAEALCVDVSNLLNTLMITKIWESKRYEYDPKPFTFDNILSRKVKDFRKESTQSEFNAATNIFIQNIENRMQHVLKSATELKNSIPVVSLEKFNVTSDKSVQTDFLETKKTLGKNSSEAKRENANHLELPKQTKNNLVCTEKRSAFRLQRSTTQVPMVNNKNRNLLKKQTSSLNPNWKDKDCVTTNGSPKKKSHATANAATEENMRATGAIPKKTSNLHRNALANSNKRTGNQVKSKTKPLIAPKPVWR